LKKAASIEEIKHKLFIDEFFDPHLTPKEILPKHIKSYDLKLHQHNENFLKDLFKQRESILPI